MQERLGRVRLLALALTVVGTSGCSTLMRLARYEAEERAGETGRAPTPTVVSGPPTALDAPAPDMSPIGRGGEARDEIPEPAAGTASTYESTPMLGLSAQTFARPYSVTWSLVPRPEVSPECRFGPRTAVNDVWYAPEPSPVDASGPLGLRAARQAPYSEILEPDPALRSARAFQSGALLAGERVVCGGTTYGTSFYVGLTLGWSRAPTVAVAR